MPTYRRKQKRGKFKTSKYKNSILAYVYALIKYIRPFNMRNQRMKKKRPPQKTARGRSPPLF